MAQWVRRPRTDGGAAAWRPHPGAALLPACEPEPVVTVTEVATGPEGYFVHQQKRVLRGKSEAVHRAPSGASVRVAPPTRRVSGRMGNVADR